jgi:3-phytase
MRGRFALVLAGLGALGGCATPATISSLPAVSVTAAAETVPVGTSAQDAADDPAIWRNPADPAASLIVATDKKAGLHVYGLDGRPRHFDPAGLLNNVDLVDMGAAGVIVVASDRNDLKVARLRVYRLDTAAARLVPLGTVPGGAGEGYGLCLLRKGDALHAFSVLKHGAVEEFALDLTVAGLSARPVRSMKLATQTEGCVADPRSGALYVGEEARGIWRFAAGATTGELVAAVDGRQLVADVEGLALVADGLAGGYLVASSQGDNAFAVYRLPGMEPVGRFRIAAGRFGSVEETDGIELVAGSFGEA